MQLHFLLSPACNFRLVVIIIFSIIGGLLDGIVVELNVINEADIEKVSKAGINLKCEAGDVDEVKGDAGQFTVKGIWVVGEGDWSIRDTIGRWGDGQVAGLGNTDEDVVENGQGASEAETGDVEDWGNSVGAVSFLSGDSGDTTIEKVVEKTAEDTEDITVGGDASDVKVSNQRTSWGDVVGAKALGGETGRCELEVGVLLEVDGLFMENILDTTVVVVVIIIVIFVIVSPAVVVMAPAVTTTVAPAVITVADFSATPLVGISGTGVP
jgi:hypothetical protein